MAYIKFFPMKYSVYQTKKSTITQNSNTKLATSYSQIYGYWARSAWGTKERESKQAYTLGTSFCYRFGQCHHVLYHRSTNIVTILIRLAAFLGTCERDAGERVRERRTVSCHMLKERIELGRQFSRVCGRLLYSLSLYLIYV